MNYSDNYNISYFDNKKIIKKEVLSESFGAFCEKIFLEDSSIIVAKGLIDKNTKYKSIYYEGKCLQFMHEKFPEFFPDVLYLKDNFLVINYITNNNVKNYLSEQDLAYKLSKIHNIKNEQFGFEFDPPIGGLKQPSKFQNSWVEFYSKNRLEMIFTLINSTNPMPKEINVRIETIIKNLKNMIPDNPKPSLIHGDLWEGNILFNDNKLCGLIDPGIYYAHSELEISYLEWFNYVSKDFYKYYNEYNELDKEYFSYSPVYQLYYCLLNVHLWSREYIKNTAEIVKRLV